MPSSALRQPLRAAIAVAVFLPLIAPVPLFAAAPAASAHNRPYKNTHEIVALARLRGESTMIVLIASAPGKNAAVAAQITKLGGEIHKRYDEVDYLRARVPVDAVFPLAASPDIVSLDTDLDYNKFNPVDTFPDEVEKPSNTPPDPDTPLSHPYLPQREMDITAFKQGHPTYDGRGVGMAILDATPDVLLPELQRATSLDGKPERKMADLISITDPRDDDDPMWVKMDHQIHVTGGKFTFDKTEYTASADGDYRFGLFDERALKAPGYLHQDVNFDGNPEGSSGLFAVLWDERTGTVWVDTNQDHSFADERGLQEYSIHGDLGIFGAYRPTPRRKTVAFGVQLNPELHYVRLNLGVWQHVTEVAGATIGKGFYGGAYDGIAGDAQFISYNNGDGSVFRRVESVIEAAMNPKVDVICLEPAIIEQAFRPLHDGKLVAGVIFDRVTDKYKKPLLSPANNTFGMTTVIDEVSSRGILAIGAYQHADAYRINNGAEVAEEDNLHLVGSFGPSGDGRLKPDILSPSELISTDAGYKPANKMKGVWELPPGYEVSGGTSTAGPSASAAVALLISAARQQHVPYDAERIRTALLSTARFLPRIPAYQQGNGLVQVNAAWKMLQQLQDKWEPLSITSSAPVHTEYSQYLNPANSGPGIFEREGWSAHQQATRTITFTRTSGPAEPILFELKWVGNAGAFSSATSITLPLNQPVTLPVSIQTADPGVYSAILNLERPQYPGIAYQVLNTVVAAHDFNEENSFTVHNQIAAPRPGTVSTFYRVPKGTPALRIHLAIPNRKPTLRVMAFAPDLDNQLSFDLLGMTEKGYLDKVIENPTPGVWEIELWDNNFVFDPAQIDSKPLSPVAADLTVSTVGISAAGGHAPMGGTGKAGTVSFVNNLSPVLASIHSFPLASRSASERKIAEGEQQIIDMDVPEGAKQLTARIHSTAASGSDLDLYVYEIVKGIAILRGQSDGPTSDETVTIPAPDAGKWKIVIEAFHLAAGTTTFHYEDLLFHPAFGSVEVDDKPAMRAHGASWSAAAHIDLKATPGAGRTLAAELPVIADAPPGEPGPTLPISLLKKDPVIPPAVLGAAILATGSK